MRFWDRLRTRLLLVVALAILPALIVFAVTALADREHALAQAQNQVLTLARLKIGAYEEFADLTQAVLETLSAVPAVAAGREPNCREILARILARDRRYANFGVVAADGRVLCSGLAHAGGENLLDYPAIRTALQSGRFTVSGYERGAVRRLPEMMFAQPINGAAGKLIYAAVSLSWLSAVDGSAMLPAENSFYLVDGAGRILVARPDGARAGSRLALLQNAQWSAAGTAFGLDHSGRPTLFGRAAFRLLPHNPQLYAVVGIPTATVLAPHNRALIRNLLLTVGLMAVFALIAWFGSDWLILRQVDRLLEGVGRVRGGDYGGRVALTGSGELAELGMEFDRMAEVLEQRRRDTESHIRHISRLSRLYRVISAVNGAVLRLRNRQELLQEACRVAVEVGNFRFAWAGFVDAAQDRVEPLAYAGAGETYFRNLRLSTREDRPEGRGIVGRAVRAGGYAISNDIEADPGMAYWQAAARAHGYRSAGAFALKVEGRVAAVLAVYSGEREFFDAEETRLMRQVAGDVGLGLEHIFKAEQAEFLANFDQLTGLPNKSYFLTRLQAAVSEAQAVGGRVAVMAVELRELGRINDTLGYAAGDQLIKQACARLGAHLEPGDLLARLGGQTLGVLLPKLARQEDLPARVARVLQAFPCRLQLDTQEILLRLSAGVAVYPLDADTGEELYRQAELVLHSAAQDPATPCRFYSRDIDRQAATRYAIETALAHALERRELSMFYQPIVDIGSRAPVGVEALLRWHSPQLGTIPPTDFIPIAEASGEIVAIGYWAMEQACHDVQDWLSRGWQAVPVSINFSARQLQAPDFTARVQAMLPRCGGQTPLLRIEITESQLLDAPERIGQLLQALRALGVGLALDDFGTGYSSLSYLNQLPVDCLKIDRSFVQRLGEASAAETMARGIIGLAHSLALKVVAEGVETEKQLAILQRLGCDQAQGYLFSPPLPAAEAEVFLRAARQRA